MIRHAAFGQLDAIFMKIICWRWKELQIFSGADSEVAAMSIGAISYSQPSLQRRHFKKAHWSTHCQTQSTLPVKPIPFGSKREPTSRANFTSSRAVGRYRHVNLQRICDDGSMSLRFRDITSVDNNLSAWQSLISMNKNEDFRGETQRDKIAEIQALIRQYGYSIDAACELVGLERRLYRPRNDTPLTYIPTPEIIRFECAKIRRFGLRHQVKDRTTDASDGCPPKRFRNVSE